MIFYFSGTGNSTWIARELADFQQESLCFIPDEMKKEGDVLLYSLRPDEKIGFVFPIYSWGPPKIVLEFINRLFFENYKKHYLFFVCSCGDDIGLTRQVFTRLLKKKDLVCDAGFSVIMPNNYVLMKGFDTDPKELERKKLKGAIPAMAQINKIVAEKGKDIFQVKEGSFAFIKTKVINPLFNKYEISAKHFWVTDDCISCGLCEKACPVNNVTLDVKPVWGDYCTSCLACYHVCPKQAVQYGKATKGKGQYMNPMLSTKM